MNDILRTLDRRGEGIVPSIMSDIIEEAFGKVYLKEDLCKQMECCSASHAVFEQKVPLNAA